MAKTVMTRVDEELWQRIEGVMQRLALSQSSALRALLMRGLEVVERELSIHATATSERSRGR